MALKKYYNIYDMPLSNDLRLKKVQEKLLNGLTLDELSVSEKLILGDRKTVRSIDGYDLKPDCVYRVVNEDLYSIYKESGYIFGIDENDEYEEHIEDGMIVNNNRGVDWFLGGACLKYGNVILECPADSDYFVPAYDNGCHLSIDPLVRHFKSSGFKNPVPMSMVKVIKRSGICKEYISK